MGKIYSMLARPVRTFNIANRAERVISQEKPKAAPQYAATDKQRALTDKVNPYFLEGHYQKNTQLDQRLKDVFVTSTDSQEIKKPVRESNSLPQSRHSWENEFLYESHEFTVIPTGKCSLKQALVFLMRHKRDPITYNSETIASEYKMEKKVVGDILKHFKLYVTVTKDSPLPIEDPIQEIIDQTIVANEKKAMEKK